MIYRYRKTFLMSLGYFFAAQSNYINFFLRPKLIFAIKYLF